MNLRTLAVSTALVCVAAPAWANPIQKNSPGAAQVFGDGSSAQAQHQAQAQRQRQTATGGGGGAGGNAAGGNAAGGLGGSSAVSVTNSGTYGGGNGNIDARSAPSLSTMAPAAGGQCGVVGFGLGATGTTGGGIVSGSWESTNCAARVNAAMLAEWGYKPQAVSLLRSVYPDVDAAFKAAPVAASQPAADPYAIDLCAARPGWTAAELAARYPQQCRR